MNTKNSVIDFHASKVTQIKAIQNCRVASELKDLVSSSIANIQTCASIKTDTMEMVTKITKLISHAEENLSQLYSVTELGRMLEKAF